MVNRYKKKRDEKLRKLEMLDHLLIAVREHARIKRHNRLFAGCLKTETMLDYINHNLTPEEVEIVKKHLRKCHSCADEVKVMRKTMLAKRKSKGTRYNDELL